MNGFLLRFLTWSVRRAVRRERPQIVAVAGSVGKTSTKLAAGIALGDGVPGSGVRASAKNYNNELGVPLTILGRPAPGRSPSAWIATIARAKALAVGLGNIGAKTLVLEYGTDHPGDLKHLISIARPDVAVLTAIGAEHTEYFGSIDAVAEEERDIVRALGPDGIAVLNADDPVVLATKDETKATVVTFGESPDADVRLLSYRVAVDAQDPGASGLDIHIDTYGTNTQFRITGAFGKPHALAVSAALAVIVGLDDDIHAAIQRLRERYHGMIGRTRLIEGIKRTMLLDDTYNSSPLAALSAIRDLVGYPVQDGCRRIAALGDMLELGNLSDESHRLVGKAVAEAGIDMLVAVGAMAHVVRDAAVGAGMPEDRAFAFAASPEAGLFIQERLRQGDAVLIKGSQGVRMEKITKELMAHPEHAQDLLVRQADGWEER
ncbi:UDP-N-acetylmuramoyl-tripeptide--D-alanyl-D-alanine ligase [Candidatus Uhrbacteria bacterium]|nr:UDP-N-acetylmuramoyl-tripeptide--D-alanyl-D-alanine ligase [Candidatus Uhrbacteria bacterium]